MIFPTRLQRGTARTIWGAWGGYGGTNGVKHAKNCFLQ